MKPLLLLSLPAALALEPRAPLPSPEPRLPPFDPTWGVELHLKLHDAVRGRARADGRLESEAGIDLGGLRSVLAAHGARSAPLLDLAPSRLQALQARAEARTGRAAADLQGLWRVTGPADPEALLDLARRLHARPEVEFVALVPVGTPPPGFTAPLLPPPPEDYGTETPDFSDRQGYLDDDPGIGAWTAWADGLDGGRVRLSDVEYGWELEHEDLVDKDIPLEAGRSIPDIVVEYGYDLHGTATLGEILAVDNGYGCTGGAPAVQAGVYPEYDALEGSRRAAAIASAAADSAPGDVIMLEMQLGLRTSTAYGPAELDPGVWTAVRTATDAGMVVVAAAGNGGEDLDDAFYADYRARGDSGAVLVGAATADTRHQPLGYTTHGSRVNLQGWGEDVVTLSYGDLATIDGDPDQRYTARFSGTSSATPIVAVAALLVQDHALATWGEPLDPLDLRQLLVDTGIPQGDGVPIGPLPDVPSAVGALDDDGDGYRDAAYGGDDCDDEQQDAFPGGTETWYDGIDGDCAGDDDYDADGDGWADAGHGGEDCDDDDPAVSPDATEVQGNGVDDDCDPDTEDAPGDDDDDEDPGKGGGCCSTSPAGPSTGLWLALAALLALRRRDATHRRG